MKALTLQEIDALCVYYPRLQFAGMVSVQFSHAMRSSEVTGLLRSDVDLQARTIKVRRLKRSKTNLQPIRDDEHQLLTEWLAVAPQSKFVFPNSYGHRLSRSTYYHWFHNAAQAIGLPKEKSHSHCLKHSCIQFLISHGVGLAHVQSYAGHSQIASTMQYLKISDDESAAEASKAFAQGE